ncbi:hypothetical protein T636_A2002 [Enterobacter hormaechei subsp. xiangfangensis]|nr:hypothetical protein T636_A2002 [Enterobacter hormaechei subsp. xiangfangensis]RAL76264.1 putative membrane protein [Enterobacter hormaechei]
MLWLVIVLTLMILRLMVLSVVVVLLLFVRVVKFHPLNMFSL